MFLDAGLTNPVVAADMATFLDSTQGDGEHVGIAAFVVFTLSYRLRVHVWFQDVCRDVVNEFAPWANDFIDYRPIYDAISCGHLRKRFEIARSRRGVNESLGGCDCVRGAGYKHG